MSLRQTGLQSDGRLAVWQGFVRHADVEQELAQVGPRRGKSWRELDGPAQVLERPVILAQGVQGRA